MLLGCVDISGYKIVFSYDILHDQLTSGNHLIRHALNKGIGTLGNVVAQQRFVPFVLMESHSADSSELYCKRTELNN